MELRHLRYFVAAIEEGSLQGAAQRLNVAQPALSRRVRDLEAELGCELLERGPRGVTPTRAGLALYRDSIAMLDNLNETMQTARRLGLEQDREIRVGLAPATSRKYRFVQAALTSFAKDFPEAGIAYSPAASAQLAQAMRNGDFDIALLFEQHPASPRVEERLIHSERYVLAAYPSHPLATRGPVAMTDLAGERLVWMSRHDLADSVNPMTQQMRRHGLEPVIAQIAADTEEQLDLVMAGAGICLTPASTMLIVPEGQLVFRPLPEFEMTLQLRFAWQKQPMTASAHALYDVFHRAIDGHQARIASGNGKWTALEGHSLVMLPNAGQGLARS